MSFKDKKINRGKIKKYTSGATFFPAQSPARDSAYYETIYFEFPARSPALQIDR